LREFWRRRERERDSDLMREWRNEGEAEGFCTENEEVEKLERKNENEEEDE